MAFDWFFTGFISGACAVSVFVTVWQIRQRPRMRIDNTIVDNREASDA